MTIDAGRRQYAGRHSGRQAPTGDDPLAGQAPATDPPAGPPAPRRPSGLAAGRAQYAAQTGTPDARRRAREVLETIAAGQEG